VLRDTEQIEHERRGMVVLKQINVTVNDTGTPALTDDDATEITRAIYQVLERYTQAVTYAAAAPHVTLALT